MIFYVVVGGMKGTTWVQIVKAALLMTGATLLTILVMFKFGWNVSRMLGDAAAASGKGERFLNAGQFFAKESAGLTGKLDLISLGLALVLGTAGLPHILIRFYTVPTAKDARKSVIWGIGIIGSFYLMTLALGFGAAALVGRRRSGRRTPQATRQHHSSREPSGTDYFGSTGGTIMLALIAAVAFATILAVVAGLTLASSSSFAHDIYANVIHHGEAPEGSEVRVARIAAFVIGGVSIVLSIFAQSLNVAFLVALAFAVGGVGEPAGDPLQPVLEEVQHDRRDGGDLRRSALRRGARHLLAGRLREASGDARWQEPVAVPRGHRLLVVPARQPGPGLDSDGLPVRLHRDDHEQGVQQGEVRRARGAVAHGRRHGEGELALS
jgi:Na+/proline symporter